MAPDPEEPRWWEAYRTGGDTDSQQRLFFHYVPWARAVARDVYRRARVPQMDWSDYAQNATIGLLEAMSRFDPVRGIAFTCYAKPRVRGAVFNGLRSFLAHSRVQGDIGRWHDRVATFDLSDSDDPLERMISTVSGLGIGFLLDTGRSSELLETPDASLAAEQKQMDVLLADAIATLPEKERLVVSLHYYQHLPFVEIARMLALTKGRISQIHKAAIERIRLALHRGDDRRQIA